MCIRDRPKDASFDWSFNQENLLIGLWGTESDRGITSLGVLSYDPACANEALGFNVDGQAGNKNYQTGVIMNSEQNADGTYQFATRPLEFENEELLPSNVASKKQIWSFDNPDLVEDAYEWTIQSPNVYYVGGGLLALALLLMLCICCCCRCCCKCCCAS